MTKFVKIFLIVTMLAGILIVPVSAQITYTETAPSSFPVQSPVDTWNLYNITADKGVPFNAVAEIMVYCESLIEPETVGIREVGSSNARYLLLGEAEGGGKTINRFLVNVNGSGFIEIYGSRTGSTYSGFTLVGYWMGVTFTEQWVSYSPGSGEADVWHETDGSELALSADKVHLITLTNDDAGREYLAGVRNTTSSLNRYIYIMEAEGGGVQTASMFVTADSSSKIDVYSGRFDDIIFHNQGFFDENMEFEEKYGWTNPASDGWTTRDVSGIIDQPGRVVDYLISNAYESLEVLLGIRTNGSGIERRLELRESEGGGYSSMGMSVQTDSNGILELYTNNWILSTFAFTGYFKPVAPIVVIGDVNLLHGAGFNYSDPYVYLRWNYTGEVDNYEIQHSSDGVSFSFLDYTPTEYYNHSSLVNGSYHYYKIRSTYFSSSWYNSSFSRINLERVWFEAGEPGSVNITILSGSWEEYNVSSISVETGTYIHGNTSSPIYVDGKTYRVDEVVGVPGFDVRFNFTGIPENSTSLSMRVYSEYEGNPAHDIDIEAWSFENESWVNMIHVPEHGFRWHNASLSLDGFIEEDTGKVWIRIYHYTSGANGHYLNVDYLRLRAFVPTGGIVNLDAWSINWLIGILWLGLTAIGVFKENKILIMFAGFMGIILGLLLLGDSAMGSIALICLNLYLLYEGTQ